MAPSCAKTARPPGGSAASHSTSKPNVALIRDSDGGALDGDTVYDRAVGPMQFIPSTWRSVNADGNGDGFGDPNNMFDAAQGAAQYLCTGTSNLGNPAQAAQAVRRYNNADSYVRIVLALARMYQAGRVIGLPSTGDQLPDEPTDPPAVRAWPTDPPPAVRPWTTSPPPDGPVLAKPAPAQRTERATPPRAATRPQTTTPPPNPASPDPPSPSLLHHPRPRPPSRKPLTTTTATDDQPEPVGAEDDAVRADTIRAQADAAVRPGLDATVRAGTLRAEGDRAQTVGVRLGHSGTVRRTHPDAASDHGRSRLGPGHAPSSRPSPGQTRLPPNPHSPTGPAIQDLPRRSRGTVPSSGRQEAGTVHTAERVQGPGSVAQIRALTARAAAGLIQNG